MKPRQNLKTQNQESNLRELQHKTKNKTEKT